YSEFSLCFFFSSRRRHTRSKRDWSSDVCSSDLEIALVIGEPAYRVTLAQAWDHVAYVTASNDFGMYDLRGNDRGSNVRNKSGDRSEERRVGKECRGRGGRQR